MANHGRRGGGPQRGSRRPARGGLRSSFVPQSSSRAFADAPHSAFSLQDEARNTESRHKMWSTDVKLRHKAISFVSAGSLAGSMSEEMPEETPEQDRIINALARSEDAMAHMNLGSLPPAASAPAELPAVSFFVDTAGSNTPVETGLPPPTIRSASPTPSDSSEEVVLFKGRNQVKTVTDPAMAIPSNSRTSTSSPSSDKANDGNGVSSANHQSAQATTVQTALPTRSAPSTAAPRVQGSRQRPNRRKKGRQMNRDPDDEAIADYLENIRAQEDDNIEETLHATSNFNRRVLDLMDGDEWEEVQEQVNQQASANDNPHGRDWESPQLQDFDGISTSSEVSGNVDRILRKRERRDAIQYLVVFENTNEDEARWLPSSRMTQARDLELITAFEEIVANLKFGNERSGSESWSDDSEDDQDEDEEDDDDDDESFEDEKDLIERKIERMSDETIARLLAKQEELGMGSNELLLFDDDGDLDVDGLDGGYGGFVMKPSRGKRQKSRRGGDNFPPAGLMADVIEQDPYNGFDIMDFDRPSLRKKKGRAANLPFELSDDDLDAQLRSTWETDRKKKSLKKQEREELRAQGLLGKKNKFKPDLNAKYDEGMSFVQIKEEIRTFLNSPCGSRAFPPMDKHDRAAVHQLGAALGLNSRSVGSGTSRFTTLIKTSRTVEYDDITFAKITSRFQNRFAQRMDKRGGKKRVGGGGGGGSGGRHDAATYRDGDVVGGSAPEIGADNKGRAMLEKMGWSSGTALGALNNKGILQPVTHIVKTSKTGLG